MNQSWHVYVTLSHPDSGNDDTIAFYEFDDEQEARQCFQSDEHENCYYELANEPGKSVAVRKSKPGIVCKEYAMQAGMMGGCQAYNHYIRLQKERRA